MTAIPAKELLARLERIAAALERQSPPVVAPADPAAASAFVWQSGARHLEPVIKVNRVDLELLHGIDRVRDILLDNTIRFAGEFPANNALLWGARGMGKSSLVKAVHHAVNEKTGGRLKLVEIHREDIETLPQLMALI